MELYRVKIQYHLLPLYSCFDILCRLFLF